MTTRDVTHLIERIPGLRQTGEKLARFVHSAVVEGGERVRTVADVLHGTWLGHPLHPVLTDVTVGAWTLASLFDGIARYTDAEDARRQADILTGIGLLSALPTALTGLMDFASIKKPAISQATLHLLLNDIALACYLCSFRERRRGNRGRGELLSCLGLLALAGGAWVGGHLVYRERVGVNHAEPPTFEDGWVAAMPAGELARHSPTCVHLDGTAILLVRTETQVHAIGAVCSHAGGPLQEGFFDENAHVRCPWHDSVFDLRTGNVVHGPATHPQPAFDARIHDDRVEIRRSTTQ